MTKWWFFFWLLVIFLIVGTIGVAWVTATTPHLPGTPVSIEVMKNVMLCFGAAGVILPVYVGAINAIEERQVAKLERTFELIRKWDSSALLAARKFTRQIRDERERLSDKKVIKRIKSDPELLQSVVLVSNYFEHILYAVKHDLVDKNGIAHVLGPIVVSIINRFEPFFSKQPERVWADLCELRDMFSCGKYK